MSCAKHPVTEVPNTYCRLGIRHIKAGEPYGLNDVLVADCALIQFTDLDQDPVRFPNGQHICYLPAQAVVNLAYNDTGVDLDGGIASWSADATAIRRAGALALEIP